MILARNLSEYWTAALKVIAALWIVTFVTELRAQEEPGKTRSLQKESSDDAQPVNQEDLPAFAMGKSGKDYLRAMQFAAVDSKQADWIHWGDRPDKFSNWTNHSNRLIPVYSFGLSMDAYKNDNSAYRDIDRLTEIYRNPPVDTVNPDADYMDQTDIYRLQKDAVAAGKKHVIVMVFDGMDWPTTQAASVYKNGKIMYTAGRGSGLKFLDYRCQDADFGFMVTSPANRDTDVDVNSQIVTSAGEMRGGYNAALGGKTPWDAPASPSYLLGKSAAKGHAYTDSASSATSMATGMKTFNGSICVGCEGEQFTTIAHELQQEGYAVGLVSSVPISHATPGGFYAHNVNRSDYQDITRDLLGLKSISHRGESLPGVDVLIGCGWGEIRKDDRSKQGNNYVPGNKYLADDDVARIDISSGGKYRVVQRQAGSVGAELLAAAADEAANAKQRLFGFFGVEGGHLPYRTADGNYDPTRGENKAERYTDADVSENPTLADMTAAALQVLHSRSTGGQGEGEGESEGEAAGEQSRKGFWLMVECGDVDWANHNNNVDDAIGSVISGDEAFAEIVKWVEKNSNWDETAVILTADHGHMMVLDRPEALIAPTEAQANTNDANENDANENE